MMHLEFAPEYVHVAFSGPLTRHRLVPVNTNQGAASETDVNSLDRAEMIYGMNESESGDGVPSDRYDEDQTYGQ